MTRVNEFHKKWMDDPEYAKSYGELETELAIAREMIEARARRGSHRGRAEARRRRRTSAHFCRCKRTPGASPFVNSTPAASSAAFIFAFASSETGMSFSVSARFTVGRDNPALAAKSA
jgi:hypothetical protein